MSESHDNNHDNHHGHVHHITSMKMLGMTFGILIVGMVATIAAALLLPQLWPGIPYILMWTIALGIALIKASFVVQIFMGVKWSTGLTKVFAYGGFIWFLFMYIAMVDYSSRWMEPVHGWEGTQETALPR